MVGPATSEADGPSWEYAASGAGGVCGGKMYVAEGGGGGNIGGDDAKAAGGMANILERAGNGGAHTQKGVIPKTNIRFCYKYRKIC